MKCPQFVKAVFDKFPLKELPSEPTHPPQTNVLYTYQPTNGVCLDPKCLIMYMLLTHESQQFQTVYVPPQSTSKSLPIYTTPETVITNLDDLLAHFQLEKSEKHTMLTPMLNDLETAFKHELSLNHKLSMEIYSPQTFTHFPLTLIQPRLASQHVRPQPHKITSTRLDLIFLTLQTSTDPVLAIYIASYVIAIYKLLPTTELAAKLPVQLIEDAERVYNQYVK